MTAISAVGQAKTKSAPMSGAAHGEVGAAVGFAQDDGDFRHGGRGVGEEHFRAVADDAAAFLLDAGHEAGNVHQRHERDVEHVAEPDEPRGLVRGINVERAGLDGGLLAMMPTTMPWMRAKPTTMFCAHSAWTSRKSPLSTRRLMTLATSRGFFGVFGHEVVHFRVRAQVQLRQRADAADPCTLFAGRKESSLRAICDGVRVVVGDEMDVAAHAGVGHRRCRFRPWCISGR